MEVIYEDEDIEIPKLVDRLLNFCKNYFLENKYATVMWVKFDKANAYEILKFYKELDKKGVKYRKRKKCGKGGLVILRTGIFKEVGNLTSNSGQYEVGMGY